MMGKVLWQGLKRLVKYDKDIMRLHGELALLAKKYQDIKDRCACVQNKKEALDREYKDLEKAITAGELDVRSLRSTQQAKQIQLDSAQSQREVQALESELALLSERCKIAEDAVLALYHKHDECSKQRMQCEKDFENSQIKVLEEGDVFKREHDRRARDLEQFELDRQTLFARIPPEWAQKYERMRQSVEDPIVPVINNCCSSCYYGVLHHDLSLLKRHMIVSCRNCYRLLYLDEQEAIELQKACF